MWNPVGDPSGSTRWMLLTGLVFTHLVMTESAALEMARTYFGKWPDVEYVSLSYLSQSGDCCSVGVMR